jgi:HEAT repeat protein
MTQQGTVDEEKRQRIIAINKEASKPILGELSQAGFEVESISDLYNKRMDYRRVISLLVQWLPRVENPAVKESIVRALSVPWAKRTIAPKLLVDEFSKQVSNPGLQWAIGNALSIVADDDVLNNIVGLIRDKAHGKAREMLVVSLGNMKTPEVEHLLIELLDDEDLAGYSIVALGKLKSQKARPVIERHLTHPKGWIRREAKKALKRIDK